MTHPGTATSNTITSCILHLYSTQQFIKVNSANRAKIKAYQQRVLTLEARVPLAAETVLCMIYSTCDLWQYTRAEKWQQTKFISHATAILHCRKTIEIVIKFLEAIPQICSIATNVIKITIPKWRTLWKTSCYWAEEYAASQLHRAKVNKFRLCNVSNIV